VVFPQAAVDWAISIAAMLAGASVAMLEPYMHGYPVLTLSRRGSFFTRYGTGNVKHLLITYFLLSSIFLVVGVLALQATGWYQYGFIGLCGVGFVISRTSLIAIRQMTPTISEHEQE
jgi:hypothetical protein